MPDLTDVDKATIAALLRATIAADRFPLSPRVRRWKAILISWSRRRSASRCRR